MDILEKAVENIGEIIDLVTSNFLKISSSFAVFAWLAILLPSQVFECLNILSLRNNFIELIGATAFVSSFLVILWIAYRVSTLAFSYFRSLFELSRLTKHECKRLYQFVEEESQTSTFFQTDGVIAHLEKKGFLYKSLSKPNSAGEQDYHIYPWMFRRLMNNPSILLSKIEKEVSHGKRKKDS